MSTSLRRGGLLRRRRHRKEAGLRMLVEGYTNYDYTPYDTHAERFRKALENREQVKAALRVDLGRRRPLLGVEHTAHALRISSSEGAPGGDNLAARSYHHYGINVLMLLPAREALWHVKPYLSTIMEGREAALCLLKDGYEGRLQDLLSNGVLLGDDPLEEAWS